MDASNGWYTGNECLDCGRKTKAVGQPDVSTLAGVMVWCWRDLGRGAHLASEGGEFNGYTITCIGFDKVEQAWYRALTAYFVPDETFNLAYAHIIQAADHLYALADIVQVTLTQWIVSFAPHTWLETYETLFLVLEPTIATLLLVL